MRFGAVLEGPNGSQENTHNGIRVDGRTETKTLTLRLWEEEGEGENRIAKIGADGDKVERTDDGAKTSEAITLKTLAQFFQAVGALPEGETDVFGHLGIGHSAPEIIEAIKGFAGTPVGVRVRPAVMMTGRGKARKPLLDEDGKKRYRGEVTDFFVASNGVV